ncbi:DUF4215 domain-containing protein [Myxococcaceae bacterium JPH2]|nr:DUF4215 domain-containing protein [Myxococcaceae bacterium JPH2]
MSKRQSITLSRVLGPLLAAGLLGAWDSSPAEQDYVSDAPPPEESSEAFSLTPGGDPYADAISPATTSVVLNAFNVLGAPDGLTATVVGLLNTALVLDMGAGEEGNGNLKIYYNGLNVAVLAQVDFISASGHVLATTPANLLELGLGSHVAVVHYPASPQAYRYVRIRGVVASVFTIDAVETVRPVVCGDGYTSGAEQCDDGNQLSGDGCNSVCEIESGHSCHGQPSICGLGTR